MHVAQRNVALVKQAPLSPVFLDGIHADAYSQVPWFADEQMESFAPDGFAPGSRSVLLIDQTHMTLLLKQQGPSEHQRNGAGNRYHDRASRRTQEEHCGRRNQERQPRGAGNGEQQREDNSCQGEQQQSADPALLRRQTDEEAQRQRRDQLQHFGIGYVVSIETGGAPVSADVAT